MPYKKHFPLKLDYSNFEYYRVSRKNTSEYHQLKSELFELTKKGKPISEEILNRFSSLLELIEGQEVLHYLNLPIDESKLVYEYFDTDELRKKYLFSDKFTPMVTEVIGNLLDKDKKNELSKDMCIRVGIVNLLEYCADVNKYSIEEIKQFNKYKICAIAACIADKVFDLRPRGRISNSMSEEDYFQTARPVCELIQVEKPSLFNFLNT